MQMIREDERSSGKKTEATSHFNNNYQFLSYFHGTRPSSVRWRSLFHFIRNFKKNKSVFSDASHDKKRDSLLVQSHHSLSLLL